MSALKDYTTKKPPEQTMAEIQNELKDLGLRGVVSDYDDTGNIVSMSFKLLVKGNDVLFRLPADWRPVLKAMEQDKRVPNYMCNEAQARRTAWRQVFHWVEAQCALAKVGMVKTEIVFLPYAMNLKTGKTLGETFEESPTLLLNQ